MPPVQVPARLPVGRPPFLGEGQGSTARNDNGRINPGTPDIYQGEQVNARPPSWGAGIEGLTDAQLKNYIARDKMQGRDHYYSSPNSVQFIPLAVPDPTIVGRAQIQPPTFDMRPDLRDVGSGSTSGQSVPVWKEATYGSGLYLFIRLYGIIADINQTVKVYSIQFGDVYREDLVQPLQQPEEVTSEFFDGASGMIFSWAFPAYRYWRVELRFDQLTGPLNNIGTKLRYAVGVY